MRGKPKVDSGKIIESTRKGGEKEGERSSSRAVQACRKADKENSHCANAKGQWQMMMVIEHLLKGFHVTMWRKAREISNGNRGC